MMLSKPNSFSVPALIFLLIVCCNGDPCIKESLYGYRVMWAYQPQEDTVQFLIRVNTLTFTDNPRWVAIGFSDDMYMPTTDVVIGWYPTNTLPVVEERYIITKSSPVRDQFADVITNVAMRKEGDYTYMAFTRPRVSSDPFDITLRVNQTVWESQGLNCGFFFLPNNPGVVSLLSRSIEYHRETPERYQVQCLEECIGVVPPLYGGTVVNPGPIPGGFTPYTGPPTTTTTTTTTPTPPTTLGPADPKSQSEVIRSDITITSEGFCAQLCLSDPLCLSFIWLPKYSIPCTLSTRASCPNPVASKYYGGGSTFVRKSPLNYFWTPGESCVNQIVSTFQSGVASVTSCASACLAQTGCISFVFNPNDFQGRLCGLSTSSYCLRTEISGLGVNTPAARVPSPGYYNKFKDLDNYQWFAGECGSTIVSSCTEASCPTEDICASVCSQHEKCSAFNFGTYGTGIMCRLLIGQCSSVDLGATPNVGYYERLDMAGFRWQRGLCPVGTTGGDSPNEMKLCRDSSRCATPSACGTICSESKQCAGFRYDVANRWCTFYRTICNKTISAADRKFILFTKVVVPSNATNKANIDALLAKYTNVSGYTTRRGDCTYSPVDNFCTGQSCDEPSECARLCDVRGSNLCRGFSFIYALKWCVLRRVSCDEADLTPLGSKGEGVFYTKADSSPNYRRARNYWVRDYWS